MRKAGGFTLLEVLVAMAILAGGIVVVSTSWSGNFLRMRKTTLYYNVAMLLEKKTTELDAKFKGKPLDEVIDETGDFGSDLPQYRWEFKTHEFQMPDLTAALLGNDATKSEQLIQFIKQMTEFISKSVKEGTVTVFVKSGKKEVPFSVTTYFVDYSRELNLPGGAGAPAAGGK
jgi:prepilin-type N-terminal cleavage/methylation domain-containing protein